MYENITAYAAYWLGCYHVQSLYLESEVKQVMGDSYSPLPEMVFFLKKDGEQLFVNMTIENYPRGFGSYRRLIPVIDEGQGQEIIIECQGFIEAMKTGKWEL